MKPSKITSENFIAWRRSLGLSQEMVARKLGLSLSSICSYERGIRLEGEVKIPILVALGMTALTAGLKPYGEE